MDSNENSANAQTQIIDSSESAIVLTLYLAVTHLNRLIAEARKHQIEVTLDVEYSRILDAYRPHTVDVSVKIANILMKEKA